MKMKKTEVAQAVENLTAPGAPGAPGEGAAMSSEQEQDAAALAAMVAETGAAVTVTGEPMPEPPPVPAMSAEESLAGLLSPLPHVLNFAGLKNVAGVWNAEKCSGLAERAVPVLRKYPWGMRFIGFLETGAGVEELALVMFILPVGLATAQAWKADAAAIAAARDRKEAPVLTAVKHADQ